MVKAIAILVEMMAAANGVSDKKFTPLYTLEGTEYFI